MYLKRLVGKLIYIFAVLILGIGAPFHFDLNASLNFVAPSVAFAKGGGGSDGGSDGGGSGGSSGSGSDGSGGGSSGSGSDGSGNSGSGSDGGNGSSDSGNDNGNESANNSEGQSRNANSNVEKGGKGDIEIHYSNGWTEQIKSGLYELRDHINRKVITRKARQDDYDRFQDVSPDR
jgi:hypothetical protein